MRDEHEQPEALTMTDTQATPPKDASGKDDLDNPAGWDSLANDLFGLNIRGLRTMGALFTNPVKVFDAARLADWADRYTPTIRLALSLIAVTVFLRFIWASEGSPLLQITAENLSELGAVPEGRTATEFTMDYLNAVLVTYPFTYVGLHVLMSLCVQIWGKGTPAPVRIRLYFATLVPALVMGVVLTGLFAVLDPELMLAVTSFGFLLYTTFYFITVMRVLTGSRVGRGWRAGLLAFLITVADLLSTLISSLLAFAIIGI
jgi:hypothetical protein